MGIFLSRDEVKELTGKQRQSAQMCALRAMGVEHKQRPDGRILVLRSHIEKAFDGFAKLDSKSNSQQPDWGIFDA